ncbi:hypothetical protein A5906_05035 [Bradyrhizobium sacchari]|uniref:hypothetical protein n=1 Tax=Bradyrhizobium sacchari TaxID=1399419 RepID=UPI0009B050A8|nr:hypothetical protein [Bradyrhizobium sacchari]OPY96051.1 hypothetical protein A5906_05035 [Bradyrhizobium sacchari]
MLDISPCGPGTIGERQDRNLEQCQPISDTNASGARENEFAQLTPEEVEKIEELYSTAFSEQAE